MRCRAALDVGTLPIVTDGPWQSARPRVHSLAIELTAFCNQHCDYCYNAWREDGGASVGTPERAVLLARIDRVLDAVDFEHVTLTGGEPLASHHLFPVLDHLRARHIRAQTISNGALVTPEIAERLARHRLLSVLVTLNGPSAALHDAQVGGTHFESTLRGIAILRAHRIPVEGCIVISKRNADRVAETLRLFLSLGVRKVALSRFSPAGYSVSLARELMPSRTHVTRALEDAAAVSRESGVQLFSTMPIPPCAVELSRFPEIEFHDCPIGTPRQEFALGPEGEIRHCALHRDPIAGARDVLDPSLDVATLFAPGDPHRYRATLPSYCAGCEHASTCAGGCGAAALWVRGDHAEVDPFVTSESGDAPRRRLPLMA
jgi:radical SAM protein with 4Fe4S-binding SPASM domain